MKVYLAEAFLWDGNALGVFSSLERAKAACKAHETQNVANQNLPFQYYVTEFEVDSPGIGEPVWASLEESSLEE